MSVRLLSILSLSLALLVTGARASLADSAFEQETPSRHVRVAGLDFELGPPPQAIAGARDDRSYLVQFALGEPARPRTQATARSPRVPTLSREAQQELAVAALRDVVAGQSLSLRRNARTRSVDQPELRYVLRGTEAPVVPAHEPIDLNGPVAFADCELPSLRLEQEESDSRLITESILPTPLEVLEFKVAASADC